MSAIGCDDYPRHHDSRNPDPRSKTMEQQVAGNLEHEIAEEENTTQQAELAAGDSQLVVHR